MNPSVKMALSRLDPCTFFLVVPARNGEGFRIAWRKLSDDSLEFQRQLETILAIAAQGSQRVLVGGSLLTLTHRTVWYLKDALHVSGSCFCVDTSIEQAFRAHMRGYAHLLQRRKRKAPSPTNSIDPRVHHRPRTKSPSLINPTSGTQTSSLKPTISNDKPGTTSITKAYQVARAHARRLQRARQVIQDTRTVRAPVQVVVPSAAQFTFTPGPSVGSIHPSSKSNPPRALDVEQPEIEL